MSYWIKNTCIGVTKASILFTFLLFCSGLQAESQTPAVRAPEQRVGAKGRGRGGHQGDAGGILRARGRPAEADEGPEDQPARPGAVQAEPHPEHETGL